MSKTHWVLLFLATMAITSTIELGILTQNVKAAAPVQLPAYTQYEWVTEHGIPIAKPTLLIYMGSNSVRPDPSKTVIWYYGGNGWETVPKNDMGVNLNAPQFENRNGWYGYFISKTWQYSSPSHLWWDDDSRWYVQYYK